MIGYDNLVGWASGKVDGVKTEECSVLQHINAS